MTFKYIFLRYLCCISVWSLIVHVCIVNNKIILDEYINAYILAPNQREIVLLFGGHRTGSPLTYECDSEVEARQVCLMKEAGRASYTLHRRRVLSPHFARHYAMDKRELRHITNCSRVTQNINFSQWNAACECSISKHSTDTFMRACVSLLNRVRPELLFDS